MKFLYSENAGFATQTLAQTLEMLLSEGKRVLWLISGGSGGKVTVDVAKLLHDAPLENLYVTLSDERYGAVRHANENWQILLNDGFELPGATLYRPLIGVGRQETAEQFEAWLQNTLDRVDYVIGLFGIGTDGHTAGIKPHSSAVASDHLVDAFTGEDFERITITPTFIDYVDEAIVQAFGTDKHSVIAQLQTQTLPVSEQPAQLLKTIPKVTLYSDYKETQL